MTVLTTAEVVIGGDDSPLGRALDNAQGRMQSAGQRMQRVGRTLSAKVTLPLAAIGGASIAAATRFESSMSKIEGLVGVAGDQVDQWGRDILDLAPELGRAPQELAEGLFFVTSAGFRGAEAMDVLEISAKAAASGLGETSVIADAVTSAINAYGSENLDAARAADILTAAVREGKLEAESLAPVMGNLLPTASAMSIEFEQVAGMLALFSRTGAGAAEGATSLQSLMLSLQKNTGPAVDLLESAGLSLADLRDVAAGDNGLINVMRMLDETFGDNEEALATIFGNVRAFRGVMNALSQDAETVDGVLQGVSESTGALDNAFDAAADTAGFKMAQAWSQLQAVGIQVGDVMLPAVSSAAERVAGVLDGLSPAAIKAGVAVGAIAVAAGPVLIVLGGMVQLFPAVSAAVGGASAALAKLPVIGAAVAKAFTALGAAGPIGLAVVAFFSVVSAVAAVIENWDILVFETRQLASTVGGVVKDMVSGIWRQLVTRFDQIVFRLNDSIETVKGFFSDMFQFVVGGSVVPEMVDGIQAHFARFPGVMVEPTRRAMSDVERIMARTLEPLPDLFADIVTGTKSAAEAFGEFAKSVVADLTRMIAKALVFAAISTALGFGPSFGANFSQSLGGGLGLPGRANGGFVSANQPVRVGERGEEVFVPSSAGQVVSNAQMGGGAGNVAAEILSRVGPPPPGMTPREAARDTYWREMFRELALDNAERT